MMSEQLEIRISGRDFGISLKGYNEQASQEIRELFFKNDTDLLALLRAYLDVVHKKCELESRIQKMTAKIDRHVQKHTLEEQSSSDNAVALDSAYSTQENTTSASLPTQIATNLFDTPTKEHSTSFAQKDTIA